MEYSIYKFNLDIHAARSTVCLNVSRGDTHRRLDIGFREGGRIYPLPGGCRAVFFAKKADGNLLFNHCRVEGDRVIYDLTSQTTLAAGLLECCIRIYGEEEQLLTSPIFDLRVLEGVEEDGAVESGSEFTALTKAVYDTYALIDATEEARTAALETVRTVEEKLESGAFTGPKGDKGDVGSVGNCVEKTSTMTRPVGVDSEGRLWSEGIPDTYLTEADIGGSVAALGENGKVPASQLPPIPMSSISIDTVLYAKDWTVGETPYTQTLAVAGLTASKNGFISLSHSADSHQRRAARDAILSVASQREGEITVVADGYLPETDIPVTLVILG